ncbi:unnamed protein product [Owenia fusiformis]|uniref:Uncharacterized protein n=1 Tax=Owenia fusiformis TaxID=6347 RepID=A0A8S4Q7Z6_OWEFU|nr:unnamed protein product [Owenia fusiformis]
MKDQVEAKSEFEEYLLICKLFLPLCLSNFRIAFNRYLDYFSQTFAEDVTTALAILTIVRMMLALSKSYPSPTATKQIFIVLVETRQDFYKAMSFMVLLGSILFAILLTFGLTPAGELFRILFKISDDELHLVQLGITSICLVPILSNLQSALEGILLKENSWKLNMFAKIFSILLKIFTVAVLVNTTLAKYYPIFIPTISVYISSICTLLLLGLAYKLVLFKELPDETSLLNSNRNPLTFMDIVKLTAPMGMKQIVEKYELTILKIILVHTANSEMERKHILAYLDVVQNAGYVLSRWLFGIPPLVSAYLGNNTKNITLYKDRYDRLVVFIMIVVAFATLLKVLVCWVPMLTKTFLLGIFNIPDNEFGFISYPFKLWTFRPLLYGLYTFSVGVLTHKKDTKILIVCSFLEIVVISVVPLLLNLTVMDGLLSGMVSLYISQAVPTYIVYIYYYVKHCYRTKQL